MVMTAQEYALRQQRDFVASRRAQRDEAITRLAEKGLPITLIAQRVGCTKSMVARTCEAAGVALARKIDYSDPPPAPFRKPGMGRTLPRPGCAEAGEQA